MGSATAGSNGDPHMRKGPHSITDTDPELLSSPASFQRSLKQPLITRMLPCCALHHSVSPLAVPACVPCPERLDYRQGCTNSHAGAPWSQPRAKLERCHRPLKTQNTYMPFNRHNTCAHLQPEEVSSQTCIRCRSARPQEDGRRRTYGRHEVCDLLLGLHPQRGNPLWQQPQVGGKRRCRSPAALMRQRNRQRYPPALSFGPANILLGEALSSVQATTAQLSEMHGCCVACNPEKTSSQPQGILCCRALPMLTCATLP